MGLKIVNSLLQDSGDDEERQRCGRDQGQAEAASPMSAQQVRQLKPEQQCCTCPGGTLVCGVLLTETIRGQLRGGDLNTLPRGGSHAY